MAKLTPQKIECIDDLLFMLGVTFVDIRYEMTDHIASVLEEKEGDFKTNMKEYFVTHKLQLLEQNEKAKKTARLRAVKYYFKTLSMPFSLTVFTIVFLVVYFYAKYFVERFDLRLYGSCMLLAVLPPLVIAGWNNKKVSMMRSMVKIHTALYLIYITVMLLCALPHERDARILPQRYCISITAGLMAVLAISLYRCRKQYVGKYI